MMVSTTFHVPFVTVTHIFGKTSDTLATSYIQESCVATSLALQATTSKSSMVSLLQAASLTPSVSRLPSES